MVKTIGKILGILLLLLLVAVAGLSVYISGHKEKVLAMVTAELNSHLDGQLSVGSVQTSFLKNFPELTVKLENVSIKDKRWAAHQHTLLGAGTIELAVNTAALLKGNLAVSHVTVSDGDVDLFTDSSGYSNASVFKAAPAKGKPAANNWSAELGRFTLQNMHFRVEDQKAKKLFDFSIVQLKGRVAFPDSGWNAALDLKVRASHMAFNLDNGSFLQGKLVEGKLVGGYNRGKHTISASSKDFRIGGDDFGVLAVFNLAAPASFKFHITAPALLWRHASALVSPNITAKLAMFDLAQPISVDARIEGSFSSREDPLLYITAGIKDNVLAIPGSTITGCNFTGVFLNQRDKSKPFSDANSAIRLLRFSGVYKGLPFAIDTGSISDLDQPIATGDFRAHFAATQLNEVFNSKTIRFTNGTADLSLHYRADIVNYRINKPIVSGSVSLRKADAAIVSRNLYLKNSSLSLLFSGNDLLLDHIRLQSGRSIVNMQGRIQNFMNLYYDAPEKIVVNWQVSSPQLYLGEFLGFLNAAPAAAVKEANKGSITQQLGVVLNKAKINIRLRAANVHYFDFLATGMQADLSEDDGVIRLHNVSLANAGGTMQVKGLLNHQNFALSATAQKVDVHRFFASFDNFGLKAVTADNLQGGLSARADVTGRMTTDGALVPRSLSGTVSVQLENAALLNYQPLISVGKFAFPFRDLHHILVPRLDGSFDIAGDKITIYPMQLNSSVLNADIAGIYSLGSGTDITVDVPLRNPGKDAGITDSLKLAKRRDRGIVLHIRAADDATGKLKIGWNKAHKLL